MGFFDRFAARKASPSPASPAPSPANPAAPPAPSPAPEPEAEAAAAPTDTPHDSPSTAANPTAADTDPTHSASSVANAAVKSQLIAARECLEMKDLPGALAIYEDLLRTAGDRADVLVTLSGDLGTCGYIEQIVELVAPRYDAQRHGPATGINLLQAYLATHNTDAAQHLLDILFALNRPELEERLYGFSNALAELIEAERLGKLPTNTTQAGPNGVPLVQSNVVDLVTISKPIWAYGIEAIPGVLPPPKDKRARRIAFTQLALLGRTDLGERLKAPEDELARFTRGLPLWFAELFHFAPAYAPIAVIGTMNKQHYVTFAAEWTLANLRQLIETNGSGIDYVFTGTLRGVGAESELTIKLWEVKRLRERKAFTARWGAANQDAELAKLMENIRLFMEWAPDPAEAATGAAGAPFPAGWCDTLGTSLSLFLTDKSVLPRDYLEPLEASLPRIAERAATSERASLAYLTALDRASRLGSATGVTVELFPSDRVAEAQAALGL